LALLQQGEQNSKRRSAKCAANDFLMLAGGALIETGFLCRCGIIIVGYYLNVMIKRYLGWPTLCGFFAKGGPLRRSLCLRV
jgi:hypothetical protein